MTATEADRHWLRRAVELAGLCPPSGDAFCVGAVIVAADGTEIARGHSRDTDGAVHAEESALARAGDDPRLQGATIYSSLEPCGERRSRPTPCANLIIDAGIGRVVYAWSEPPDFVDRPVGAVVLAEAGVETVQVPDIDEPYLRRPR